VRFLCHLLATGGEVLPVWRGSRRCFRAVVQGDQDEADETMQGGGGGGAEKMTPTRR